MPGPCRQDGRCGIGRGGASREKVNGIESHPARNWLSEWAYFDCPARGARCPHYNFRLGPFHGTEKPIPKVSTKSAKPKTNLTLKRSTRGSHSIAVVVVLFSKDLFLDSPRPPAFSLHALRTFSPSTDNHHQIIIIISNGSEAANVPPCQRHESGSPMERPERERFASGTNQLQGRGS